MTQTLRNPTFMPDTEPARPSSPEKEAETPLARAKRLLAEVRVELGKPEGEPWQTRKH